MSRDLTEADAQFDQLMSLQRDRDVLFGDREMARSLRPTFLTEDFYTSVQDTVYLVRQAVLKIASQFFNDERLLREELGLEDWEIELAAIPTNVIRLSATARMDSFVTENSFKFVEINAESPAGIGYVHRMAGVYRELPIFQEFTRRFPVRFISPMEHTMMGLVQIYHEQFGGTEELPAFAIVDHLDVPTIHEFRIVKEYLEMHGYASEICDPRELEVRDGWVFANGRKIDILYRRLLLNEYYEMKDDCKAFLEGYKSAKTCYLNSFRTKLVHKKAIFSFLTDPTYTHILSTQQRDAIERHIPWTRILRDHATTFRGLHVDLLEFVRSNRRHFVIKPNDEYGGKGVTIGFASSEQEWDAALADGLKLGHGVQEVVDIHREPFLMKSADSWEMVPSVVDLDPYLNGPLMGGCLVRVSSTNLANVTAGGGSLPMFILRYA
jgi:glutathionylspermidine synthase